MAKLALVLAAGVGAAVAAGAMWVAPWAAHYWQQRSAGPAQEVVRQYLHDPEAARFRGFSPSHRVQGVWCGEVNGRNRMGGMTGFKRVIVTVVDASDPSWTGNTVRFDNPDGGAFASGWALMCQ